MTITLAHYLVLGAILFAIGVLLAWLAGIRVYLTVFGVGLAGYFGWLDLPQAMQAAELIFASMLGVLFLNEAWPRGGALVGGATIIVGIVLFPWIASRPRAEDPREVQAMRSEHGA